jgi:hypothetical protein
MRDFILQTTTEDAPVRALADGGVRLVWCGQLSLFHFFKKNFWASLKTGVKFGPSETLEPGA